MHQVSNIFFFLLEGSEAIFL